MWTKILALQTTNTATPWMLDMMSHFKIAKIRNNNLVYTFRWPKWKGLKESWHEMFFPEGVTYWKAFASDERDKDTYDVKEARIVCRGLLSRGPRLRNLQSSFNTTNRNITYYYSELHFGFYKIRIYSVTEWLPKKDYVPCSYLRNWFWDRIILQLNDTLCLLENIFTTKLT